MHSLDFSVIWERFPDLLRGCAATLLMALAGMILATAIGLLGVMARDSQWRLPRALTIGFVELIRNTPFLVQIFFIFFALPQFGLKLSPTTTGVIALGINGGAYAIEIIRGGVQSIPNGQIEAGFALGLRRGQIFRDIVLKPALRAIFPSLSGQFILLTLTSSICSAVSAYELTSVAQRIESDTFRSFEVYCTITFLYLAMSWLLMTGFALLVRRAFAYPTR